MTTQPSIPDESPDANSPEEASDSTQPETASLPIDFCGGDSVPAEGDMITVKVVSVDADNGSMDVVCVPKMKTAARGVGAAVAAMKGEI